MSNITVKTHTPNQSMTVVKLTTKDSQVSTINAMSNTNYELIDDATGLAPARAVIRRVGNDLHLSFDADTKETDLVIEGYYNQTSQSIIGQTQSGVYQSYLPVSGNANDYVSQIQNGEFSNLMPTDVSDSQPFWVELGLSSPLWLAAGIVPIAILVSHDSSDNNNSPELTVTKTMYFAEGAKDAKVGDIVATFESTDADEDDVSVTLSDTENYALDSSNNVILTQKGVDLLASGKKLPAFTLTPNDGKDDGDEVKVNPSVQVVPTITIGEVANFTEDATETKAGAVVTTYKVDNKSGSPATLELSDTDNYALNDKSQVVLTEAGAALINSGETPPAFTLTPKNAKQDGEAVTVEPTITLVNDAPVLTVTETTTFVQTSDEIKEGDVAAKYTLIDEDGDTDLEVKLSDTTHYKLDGEGNILLTQAGVDLIKNGDDLPAFKLTPKDSTVNGQFVLVGPEINQAPSLSITEVNTFTKGSATTKEGAIVATYTVVDENNNDVIVILNDAVNYALDTDRNVILTGVGAALVNEGGDLPAFELIPNDGVQNGDAVTVDPATTAASIAVDSIETFVQTNADISEGDVVATYQVQGQEEGKTVTVTLSDTTNYKLDSAGHVVLTQAGVDLIASGEELPVFTLMPNDGAVDGAAIAVDPEVDNVPMLTITDVNTFTADSAGTKTGAVVATYEITDEDAANVTVILSDTVNYALNGKGNVLLTAKGVALINSGEELPEFTLTPTDSADQEGMPVSSSETDSAESSTSETDTSANAVAMSDLGLADLASGTQGILYGEHSDVNNSDVNNSNLNNGDTIGGREGIHALYNLTHDSAYIDIDMSANVL